MRLVIFSKVRADLEQARDDSLKRKELTLMELNWYTQLREELGEMGIPVEDTRRFAEAVRWIRGTGYSVPDIVTTYSDFQTLKLASETMKAKVSRLEKSYDDLQHQVWEEISALEVLNDSSNRTRSELEILKAHGFGLRELKSLTGLINEISEANGIPTAGNYAIQEFFASLVNQYETKLGFETTIRERQRQTQVLTHERDRLSVIHVANPFVPISISSLIRKGVQEDQIVQVADFLQRFPDRDVESITKELGEIKRLQASKGETLSTQVQEKNRDSNSQRVGEKYIDNGNFVDDHDSNIIQRNKKVPEDPRLSSVLFLKAEIQRMSRTPLSSEKVELAARILGGGSIYLSMHGVNVSPLDLLYQSGSVSYILEFAN